MHPPRGEILFNPEILHFGFETAGKVGSTLFIKRFLHCPRFFSIFAWWLLPFCF